jgi:hypothetical protein
VIDATLCLKERRGGWYTAAELAEVWDRWELGRPSLVPVPRRTIALKFSSHQGLGNPKEKAKLLREPEGACVLY